MKTIIDSFKKHINFSNFWIRNGFNLVILSLVINHLANPKSFPLNDSYSFPWFSILVSILIGSIVIVIGNFNFRYFKRKYFVKKINTQLLLRFLFSTLGYISIAYIPVYLVIQGLIGNYNLYFFLISLSISLLLSTIGIAVLFSKDIYKLHKLASLYGKLKVQQGGKITMINYTEIAFMYSENKIVYIIKTDGTSIVTDFTLNEVESEVSEQSFFRANRQTILHARSIEQVKSIENGKLSVVLKPKISDKKAFQIIISRYKKQEFMNWFKGKL